MTQLALLIVCIGALLGGQFWIAGACAAAIVGIEILR